MGARGDKEKVLARAVIDGSRVTVSAPMLSCALAVGRATANESKIIAASAGSTAWFLLHLRAGGAYPMSETCPHESVFEKEDESCRARQ